MSKLFARIIGPLILVASLSSGCLLPWTASQGATFEGLYTSSFEVSSFVPCSLNEAPGYGSGYWLASTPDSGFFDQYGAIPPGGVKDYKPLGSPGVVVYVRFIGDLSPASLSSFEGYGHLSLYTRQITVTELLEMTPEYQCGD